MPSRCRRAPAASRSSGRPAARAPPRAAGRIPACGRPLIGPLPARPDVDRLGADRPGVDRLGAARPGVDRLGADRLGVGRPPRPAGHGRPGGREGPARGAAARTGHRAGRRPVLRRSGPSEPRRPGPPAARRSAPVANPPTGSARGAGRVRVAARRRPDSTSRPAVDRRWRASADSIGDGCERQRPRHAVERADARRRHNCGRPSRHNCGRPSRRAALGRCASMNRMPASAIRRQPRGPASSLAPSPAPSQASSLALSPVRPRVGPDGR